MKSLLGKLGVILIGLAIFGYAEVWGADWKLFRDEGGETKQFYDAGSIILTPEGNIRVWQLTIMPFQHQKVPIRYKHLLEFNCVLKEWRHLLTEEAFPDKSSLEKEGDKKWRSIVPESPMERLYKIVCEKVKK